MDKALVSVLSSKKIGVWNNRLVALRDHPVSKLALLAIRVGLLVAVIALIVSRIVDIGWQNIVANLPQSSVFYICFIAFYFAQPLGELIIYRKLWDLDSFRYLMVFLRKRVFNFAVLAYSGEAFLYMWARSQPRLKERPLMSNIKDNMILSAMASNAMTVAMVVFFLATGQMQRFFKVAPQIELYFAIAGLLAIVLLAAVLRFRHSILGLSGGGIALVSTVHSVRLLFILVLQTIMWSNALPDVPLQTWLVILTLELVLTRIPFLPNQDLVFLALVMSVAGFIETEPGAVAGTFIMISALTQVGHLLSFMVSSITLPKTTD